MTVGITISPWRSSAALAKSVMAKPRPRPLGLLNADPDRHTVGSRAGERWNRFSYHHARFIAYAMGCQMAITLCRDFRPHRDALWSMTRSKCPDTAISKNRGQAATKSSDIPSAPAEMRKRLLARGWRNCVRVSCSDAPTACPTTIPTSRRSLPVISRVFHRAPLSLLASTRCARTPRTTRPFCSPAEFASATASLPVLSMAGCARARRAAPRRGPSPTSRLP